jgi:hypothetical protein
MGWSQRLVCGEGQLMTLSAQERSGECKTLATAALDEVGRPQSTKRCFIPPTRDSKAYTERRGMSWLTGSMRDDVRTPRTASVAMISETSERAIFAVFTTPPDCKSQVPKSNAVGANSKNGVAFQLRAETSRLPFSDSLRRRGQTA